MAFFCWICTCGWKVIEHFFSRLQTVILKTLNALDKQGKRNNVSTLYKSCLLESIRLGHEDNLSCNNLHPFNPLNPNSKIQLPSFTAAKCNLFLFTLTFVIAIGPNTGPSPTAGTNPEPSSVGTVKPSGSPAPPSPAPPSPAPSTLPPSQPAGGRFVPF